MTEPATCPVVVCDWPNTDCVGRCNETWSSLPVHPTERRNRVSIAVTEGFGFVPLRVRYRAADAAIAIVQEWIDSDPAKPSERSGEAPVGPVGDI